MIKLENVKVFNFEGAFRGLRNPMNSWHLSDSIFGIMDENEIEFCFPQGSCRSTFDDSDRKRVRRDADGHRRYQGLPEAQQIREIHLH